MSNDARTALARLYGNPGTLAEKRAAASSIPDVDEVYAEYAASAVRCAANEGRCSARGTWTKGLHDARQIDYETEAHWAEQARQRAVRHQYSTFTVSKADLDAAGARAGEAMRRFLMERAHRMAMALSARDRDEEWLRLMLSDKNGYSERR